MMNTHKFIFPDWPAPSNVRAAVTTRLTGNLSAKHDDADVVAANQRQLQQELQLPHSPDWLDQVHGATAVDLDGNAALIGDACYSHRSGKICAVMTADCLPILLCNQQGTEIAAIHAGWRGLLNGVIDATVTALKTPPQQLLAWLGPAIGPDHFEVNAEIRQDYIARHADYAAGFNAHPEQRWFGDLYKLARINLQHCGVNQIWGGGLCTYCDAERFFSYRRDKGITGRLASLIWLNKSD